jgi:hypothetical protein
MSRLFDRFSRFALVVVPGIAGPFDVRLNIIFIICVLSGVVFVIGG